MTQIEIRNLTFSTILNDITLSVRQGDYIILCGANGSGKTTLLRHLKPSLAPHGERSGEILFDGIPIESLDRRSEAALIGLCMQSPDDQLVTDRVWHEIAFGPESLGVGQEDMRQRVSQTASFFGIEALLSRNTSELSGGQKQLVNLASVLALQPRLLLLDEPTSRLDPHAAAVFTDIVRRINRELGTTVIIAEQRLEALLPAAGRVVMLESGRVVRDCPAEEFSNPFVLRNDFSEKQANISERDGRDRVSGAKSPAVTASALVFRYDKDGPDIIDRLSLSVPKGGICAVTGRNGCGKTTLLKLLCSLNSPLSGEVKLSGRAALLPQEPRDLFVSGTVRDDLIRAGRGIRLNGRRLYPDSSLPGQADSVSGLCRIRHLLDRHPYDLSGGELQRAAAAMLLMTGADILLLDEPTKGLDAPSKNGLAGLLLTLKDQGKTIILVTHDLEFCSVCADTAALMADGRIIRNGPPEEVFSSAVCTPDLSETQPSSASMMTHAETGPDAGQNRIQTHQKLSPPSARSGGRRVSASMVIMTGAMALLAVLVRAAFIMTPHFRPMAAVIMIAGICLGPASGLVTGALAAYLSNFIVGSQGPWTPWQMGAFALAGLVMGILVKRGVLNPEKRLPAAVTGGLLILLVIGPLLDTSSLFTGITGADPAAVYRAGLPVNLTHAAATALLLFILCKPFFEKISRYRRKNGI